MLCMREDGHYYLEDSTLTVKVSFNQLEFVEPDAFFTETSVILAQGKYEYDAQSKCNAFFLLRIMQPPLHENKNFRFKINENDYFGSYIKMTE